MPSIVREDRRREGLYALAEDARTLCPSATTYFYAVALFKSLVGDLPSQGTGVSSARCKVGVIVSLWRTMDQFWYYGGKRGLLSCRADRVGCEHFAYTKVTQPPRLRLGCRSNRSSFEWRTISHCWYLEMHLTRMVAVRSSWRWRQPRYGWTYLGISLKCHCHPSRNTLISPHGARRSDVSWTWTFWILTARAWARFGKRLPPITQSWIVWDEMCWKVWLELKSCKWLKLNWLKPHDCHCPRTHRSPCMFPNVNSKGLLGKEELSTNSPS